MSEKVTKSVSIDELAAGLPPLFVNVAHVAAGETDEMLQLLLATVYSGKVSYRTMVILNEALAENLAKGILQLIAARRKKSVDGALGAKPKEQ